MKQKIEYAPILGLRMPQNIKNWVKKSADANDRSMNYVIVNILRKKMEAENANSAK